MASAFVSVWAESRFAQGEWTFHPSSPFGETHTWFAIVYKIKKYYLETIERKFIEF